MKLLESNFSRRLMVTMLGVPLILLIIIGGSVPLFLSINLVVLISLFEIRTLLEKDNLRLSPYLFIPLTLVITYLMTNGEAYIRHSIFATSIIFLGFVFAGTHFNRAHLYPSMKHLLVTFSATFILAVPLSYGILLKELPLGTELLMTTIFGVFAFDSGAYIFGKILGKNKMAPSISPGKTWEGAIFGTVTSLAAVFALSAVFVVKLNPFIILTLGMIIVVLGQTGDLLESYFKRKMKSKDSGTLLPGHGGILDRIDSIVIVLPAVYYWLLLWV